MVRSGDGSVGRSRIGLRREVEGDDVGVGEAQHGVGDANEHLVAQPGPQQVAADLGGRPKPLLPSPRLLVEAGVLDRDPGAGRQRDDQVLVVGAEVRPVEPFGEVEVAEDLTPRAHRHPEEALHGWVARREADGSSGRRRWHAAGSARGVR